MKVVANIRIYLHTKFHIFLRSPTISLFLFSPADLFNWKKDLKWKNHRGPFSPRPISARELAYQPVTASPSLTDEARLSAPSSPKSTLLCSPAWQCRPNFRRRAGHPSPPHATRMVACSPATLSRHINRGAPWCPITTARCSAAARMPAP
jgi:hypothetical protein